MIVRNSRKIMTGRHSWGNKHFCHVMALLFFFLLFEAGISSAHAETTDEIKVDWATDIGLTATTQTLWITFELLKDEIAPQKCIWCQTNVMDESITDVLSWPSPDKAAITADTVAFGLVPVFTLGALALSSGLEGRFANIGADALLMAESVAISSLMNQFVKFGVGRARPFTIRDNPELYDERSDDNLSFYSGHTNMAFALVVSAGTIAHLRHYDAEPYIWGIGIPLALFVAYTRIAAQKHYFSDVLIGAVIGSTVGFIIPWLHRNASESGRKSGNGSNDGFSMGLGKNIMTFSGQF